MSMDKRNSLSSRCCKRCVKAQSSALPACAISMRRVPIAHQTSVNGMNPRPHLIPNALRAAAGTGKPLTLFGGDYPTNDGTCVRDYIHVDDLASAHVAAIEKMSSSTGFNAFNLGNGNGYSVKEVIAACETAVGAEIPYTIGPRREGDPATLVASSEKARSDLGWTPEHDSIDEIAQSAWNWERYRRDNLT